MNFINRIFLLIASIFLIASSAYASKDTGTIDPNSQNAQDQQNQGKSIRILVGFSAGGGSDVIARMLAEQLKDELNAPVVVENRPGAGGQVAAQILKAAPADGLTLFLSHDHTISILPLVTKNPGFNPSHDFVAVAGIATFVNALAVSSETPAKNFKDYIAWLRTQKAEKAAIGIPAPASVPEFLVKVLAEKYKLDVVSAPYKGSAPMMADMFGNQIAAGIGSVPEFIESHKAKRLQVIAVLGDKRQNLLQDVPTFGELGLAGFEDIPYYGLFAPAGTPSAVLEKLESAIKKVLAQTEIQKKLSAMGLNVGFTTGKQLAERERAYRKTWAEIIQKSGFEPQ